MARTSEEIETLIDDKASTYPQLSELQSNSSQVQFWNYAKKVFVFIALNLEQLFDQHKADINATIEKTETGSIEWYIANSLAFQYGDILIIDNNRPVYSENIEANKIIKRVAIKEDADAILTIKVVKGDDELEKLTIPELASFEAYVNRVKIAGTKIIVQSLDADELILNAEVILDPLIFNETGSLIFDNSFPVEEAINAQLKEFDFGGTFLLSRLIDKVMDVPGVVDFFINDAQLNNIAFNRSIESTAGYIKLNSSTQLSYVFS